MKDDEIFKVQFDTSKDIFNDFRQYASHENVVYSIDKQNTQTLKIISADNYVIELTIPDGIFEWFVDVFDNYNVKLTSDWYDGYGSEKEVLIKERQTEVESFIQKVLNHKIRFIKEKKGFKLISSFQFEQNGIWVDLIRHAKFKLL